MSAALGNPAAPGPLAQDSLLAGRPRWLLCRLNREAVDPWDGQANVCPQARGQGEVLRAEVLFRKLAREREEGGSLGGRSGGQMFQGGLQRLPQESGVECQGGGHAQPLGLSDLGRRKNCVRTAAAHPSPHPSAPGLCSRRRGIQGTRTMEGPDDALSDGTSVSHCGEARTLDSGRPGVKY